LPIGLGYSTFRSGFIFIMPTTTPISPPQAASGVASTPEEVFAYRLDFYWQAIAFYASTLLLYAVLKGSIVSGTLTLALNDPIVMVFGVLTIGSILFSGINWYMRRSVVVSDNALEFRNRFRTRIFTRHEVVSISITKRKVAREGGAYRVVKIRLANRRRLLRLRPSLYSNEVELVQRLIAFKRGRGEGEAV
jgi:hypothetical protein